MTEIRTRTRQPMQQQQPQRPSLLKTGAAAEQARVAEAERQAVQQNKKNQPDRFWVSYKGDEASRTREFVILDSDITNCPIFYEHNLPDPTNEGRRTDFQMCIKELEHCPLCEKYGDSYYVQMLTVMELLVTPFTTRDGTVVNHMRRLMPVKYQQQEFFYNLCKDTFGGNMRGAHIVTTREASQKSSQIGTPRVTIDPETRQVVRYDEQQLKEAFGHPQITSQQGKVILRENEALYPYNYEQLFQTPTAEELRRRYGGVIPAGSRQETREAWGGPASGEMTKTAPVGIMRRTPASTNNGHASEDEYLPDPDDSIPF